MCYLSTLNTVGINKFLIRWLKNFLGFIKELLMDKIICTFLMMINKIMWIKIIDRKVWTQILWTKQSITCKRRLIMIAAEYIIYLRNERKPNLYHFWRHILNLFFRGFLSHFSSHFMTSQESKVVQKWYRLSFVWNDRQTN